MFDIRFSRRWLQLALLLLVAHSVASAQNVQFLPETDVYLKLNPSWRVYVQAKNDQDAGGSPELSIGPSVQLYVKPLLRLKDITAFDLDDSKKRSLVLETGYRYITAPGEVPESRIQPMLTSHFPMKARFLISDRNRADLDWKNGFTWRYRNKLTIEYLHNPFLSLDSLRCRRGLLRKPIQQVEHHRSLRRLPVPGR
jgi:hypothetical protein